MFPDPIETPTGSAPIKILGIISKILIILQFSSLLINARLGEFLTPVVSGGGGGGIKTISPPFIVLPRRFKSSEELRACPAFLLGLTGGGGGGSFFTVPPESGAIVALAPPILEAGNPAYELK